MQSSEYESDSEEEDVKPAAMFRPVFVPKYVAQLCVMFESSTEAGA
jgi:hypothetical protein